MSRLSDSVMYALRAACGPTTLSMQDRARHTHWRTHASHRQLCCTGRRIHLIFCGGQGIPSLLLSCCCVGHGEGGASLGLLGLRRVGRARTSEFRSCRAVIGQRDCCARRPDCRPTAHGLLGRPSPALWPSNQGVQERNVNSLPESSSACTMEAPGVRFAVRTSHCFVAACPYSVPAPACRQCTRQRSKRP